VYCIMSSCIIPFCFYCRKDLHPTPKSLSRFKPLLLNLVIRFKSCWTTCSTAYKDVGVLEIWRLHDCELWQYQTCSHMHVYLHAVLKTQSIQLIETTQPNCTDTIFQLLTPWFCLNWIDSTCMCITKSCIHVSLNACYHLLVYIL